LIKFARLKMIRWWVSANYDFGFESWRILAEKMCHKSSWDWVWVQFGEQIPATSCKVTD